MYVEREMCVVCVCVVREMCGECVCVGETAVCTVYVIVLFPFQISRPGEESVKATVLLLLNHQARH